MPQRTNEFQELVTLVHQALLPTGAKVTASAMVKVPGMRDPSEIDVLIESAIGRFQMKIAVEAKDTGRKMDHVTFESLIGKYLSEGGIKVNKVVVVTRKGFYKPVIQRAEQLGIELLTLSEAKEFHWAKAPFLPFENIPNLGGFSFGDANPGIDDQVILTKGRISCSHGHQFGSVQQFISGRVMPMLIRGSRDKLQILDTAATSGEGKTKGRVELTLDHAHILHVGSDQVEFTTLGFDLEFASGKKVELSHSSKFRFQQAPHICHLFPYPEVHGATEKELREEAMVICRCCGKEWGRLGDLAGQSQLQAILALPEFNEAMMAALAASTTGDVSIYGDHKWQKEAALRFRSQEYPLDHVRIVVHTVSAEANAVCKQFELAGMDGEQQTFTHLQASAAGKKFTLVIPHHDQFAAEKIVLKIEDDSDSKCRYPQPPQEPPSP